ncbi:hypothetical protein LWI28_028607 [Acer negundo]|uniref:Uncharacterized protein n=1 Tax=Acer negundo TaxID=4023 RepID=A0AAD5I8J8_ACENE|nr:hypothetical protein LWI28_028607 [Acer negundo]
MPNESITSEVSLSENPQPSSPVPTPLECGQFRDCPPLPGILDDGTTTGQGAEAVYHDKITGACISKDDYYISKQKKLEPKLELEWGKGLAQKREAQARPEELELEKDKPFACTRDDPELDKML